MAGSRRSSSRARRAPERASWPACSTGAARARPAPSSRSTAPRSRRPSSSPRCSATSAAPSRTHARRRPGCSRRRSTGRSSSTRSGLLPEGVQGKLLKAIEDREVRRLGATRSIALDVWIIAATSEDLGAARQGGRFQEALYHRLSVLTFRLPALRARGDDIVLLAERFLARACAEYGLGAKRLGTDARQLLLDYPWPGNVRELENVMERVALLGEEAIVGAERLGLALPTGRRTRGADASSARGRGRRTAARSSRCSRPWSRRGGTSPWPRVGSDCPGTRSATASRSTGSARARVGPVRLRPRPVPRRPPRRRRCR